MRIRCGASLCLCNVNDVDSIIWPNGRVYGVHAWDSRHMQGRGEFRNSVTINIIYRSLNWNHHGCQSISMHASSFVTPPSLFFIVLFQVGARPNPTMSWLPHNMTCQAAINDLSTAFLQATGTCARELPSGGGCPLGMVRCELANLARRDVCTDVADWADPDGFTCADWGTNNW